MRERPDILVDKQNLFEVDGKIVLIEWQGFAKFGRARVSDENVIIETAWTLHPRIDIIPLSQIVSVKEVYDNGNVPDGNGRVSPHAAREIFEHVLRSALLENKCRVTLGDRDDEVSIQNALGFQANLLYHYPSSSPAKARVTWEGSRSWVQLSGMTLEEAVKVVLFADPLDLPTIKTIDRLTPPEI